MSYIAVPVSGCAREIYVGKKAFRVGKGFFDLFLNKVYHFRPAVSPVWYMLKYLFSSG